MKPAQSSNSTAVASRLAVQRLGPEGTGHDPWLREWHARRGVRCRDQNVVRRVGQATRVSFLIGPAMAGVAIYLTFREIARVLMERLVLP